MEVLAEFEIVLRGVKRMWGASCGFYVDLTVQEGSGRDPGRFSDGCGGFKLLSEGFGGSERVWIGLEVLRRFWRLLGHHCGARIPGPLMNNLEGGISVEVGK